MFPLFSVGLVPLLWVGLRKGRSGSCPVLSLVLLPCRGLDLTVSQGAPQYPPRGQPPETVRTVALPECRAVAEAED